MKSYFITMANVHGSLERLLAAVHEKGCDVVEISARRSLDETIFFVRLTLRSAGDTPNLTDTLASMSEIKQVELESVKSASAAV
jgi:acetolactate synthase regulatory subunit